MSPTVFDANAQKRDVRAQELRAVLEEEQQRARGADAVRRDELQQPADDFLPEDEVMQEERVETEVSRARVPSDYSEVLREAGSSNGLFSAFAPQPKGMTFETQHSQEKILLVLRQHPIVNLRWIAITLVLLLAPYLAFPLIPVFSFLPVVFTFFTSVAWVLFVGAYVIESFLSWYYNLYIITDERIIDVDFYSLIYKSISEAKIEKIEDVTAVTAGVLGAAFNFGNISIQTAAEKREFEFLNVPQPAKVTKFLNELILEEEKEKLEGRVL